MQHKILPILLFTVVSIIVMGCGPISNVDIDRNGATVDIELREQQVDKILKRSDLTIEDDDHSILDTITGVNFREGYIEVEGTYTDDSGATQDGGFDIEMSANDGMLDVQLTNVTIANVDPAEIEEANRELAEEFAKEAESGEIEFLEVRVTESKLIMQIAVNF